MSESKSLPVLVVGAGPAGLVCALALRKHNVPVRIIEKSTEYHVGTRGAGIMPRSLELFQALGVLDKLQRLRGMEAPPMLMYERQENTEISRIMPSLMEEMHPESSKPFTAMWFISQAVLEEVLRDELQDHGCQVELGTCLVGIKQDSDCVTATLSTSDSEGNREESVAASFLIGADGAKGVTREGIDSCFQFETKPDNGMLVGNVVIENLDTNYWHTWKRENHLFSLRPYDKEGKKFVIAVTGLSDEDGQKATAETFKSLFQTRTGRDITFVKFEWLSYFKPKVRVVNKMSEGRVFLAGDSAHVHPPHGGQGLNTSVQDSFNLSWKLALVYHGRSELSLLASYNEERLPVITEMLRQVTGLYKSSADTSAQRSTPARKKHLYMLGINYRWSSIVVDRRSMTETAVEMSRDTAYINEDQKLRAGDRAPECPDLVLLSLDGEKHGTSLFRLLTPTQHTALVFVGDDTNNDTVQKMLDVLRCYSGDVKVYLVAPKTASDIFASTASYPALFDTRGHARGGYQVTTEPLCVVIRPDGVIGAMVDTDIDTALAGYFTAIFKP